MQWLSVTVPSNDAYLFENRRLCGSDSDGNEKLCQNHCSENIFFCFVGLISFVLLKYKNRTEPNQTVTVMPYAVCYYSVDCYNFRFASDIFPSFSILISFISKYIMFT